MICEELLTCNWNLFGLVKSVYYYAFPAIRLISERLAIGRKVSSKGMAMSDSTTNVAGLGRLLLYCSRSDLMDSKVLRRLFSYDAT